MNAILNTAREAARLCILNMLAAVKSLIGDLDKIGQIVKITVMVSSEKTV